MEKGHGKSWNFVLSTLWQPCGCFLTDAGRLSTDAGRFLTDAGLLLTDAGCRVATDPGKPGKSWNLTLKNLRPGKPGKRVFFQRRSWKVMEFENS